MTAPVTARGSPREGSGEVDFGLESILPSPSLGDTINLVVARSAVPQTPRDHYLFLSLCNFLYYLGASVADWQTPRAD